MFEKVRFDWIESGMNTAISIWNGKSYREWTREEEKIENSEHFSFIYVEFAK